MRKKIILISKGSFQMNKKKLSKIITLILTSIVIINAQTVPNILFSKIYNKILFVDIAKASSGNFAVLGDTIINFYNGKYALYISIMGMDTSGDKTWQKKYGIQGNDCDGEKILALQCGGYLVTGWYAKNYSGSPFAVDSPSYVHTWILRLNDMGDTLWTFKFIGKDSSTIHPFSSVATNDGGFLVVGSAPVKDTGEFPKKVFILKLDASGHMVFNKTYAAGPNCDDIASAVVALDDGGFMVAAHSWKPNYVTPYNYVLAYDDVWMLRLNANGDTLWTRRIAEKHYEMIPQSIKKTNDNGFIVTGYYQNYPMNYDPPLDTMWVIKMNTNGDKEWEKSYCTGKSTIGKSIELTADNGFMACGEIDTGIANSEEVKLTKSLWMLRLNSQGDTLWSRIYCDSAKSWLCGYAIIRGEQNEYIVVGQDASNGLVLKFNDPINANIISKYSYLNNNAFAFANNTSQITNFNLLGRRIPSSGKDISINYSFLSNGWIIQKNIKTGNVRNICFVK
jgi:hypothetical protein